MEFFIKQSERVQLDGDVYIKLYWLNYKVANPDESNYL